MYSVLIQPTIGVDAIPLVLLKYFEGGEKSWIPENLRAKLKKDFYLIFPAIFRVSPLNYYIKGF